MRYGIALFVVVAAALAVLLFTRPSQALPVTLDCTLPLYNATGSCIAAVGDTCKDLASIFVYAQLVGRTDSVLVFTQGVSGQFGKRLLCTFDRPEGTWDLWNITADASANRSCRSNVVRRVVKVPPAPGTMQ